MRTMLRVGGLILAAAGTIGAMRLVTLTAEVPAARETVAVASLDDAADDPAIWIDRRDPAKSLIVATDKKAGLNVYGLDGSLKSSFPAGRVNNVDLRAVDGRVIVVASDRNDPARGKIAVFELDPRTAALKPRGIFTVGAGEAYGLCLWLPKRGVLNAFVVMKAGDIFQVEVSTGINSFINLVRTMKLATQSEGCVADDRTGQLYVAEEDVGIWRFDAAKTGSVEPVSVARVDGIRLVADVEGLAIAASGANEGYLVASSQGDNAYALWRLPDLRYAGRFRIAANGAIGAVQETDGIEVTTAPLPGFPGGLMIAQDGDNAPRAQNFKLVGWAEVQSALRLR